jgi:hypothetical protein
MLPTKPYLTQAHVQKILEAANQYATEKGHIVAIAVCDDGGHLLGLIRRDGCQPVSSYFAQEKARTAAMGKRETQVYEEMINKSTFAPMNIEKEVEIVKEPEPYQREMIFTQRQIEHLQHKVFEITGEGEVMKLFNEMLGVSVG